MNKETPRDILLTGLPRAGTTLTCYLLNKLPNTVALHEPYNPFLFAQETTTRADLVKDVDRFLAATRQALLYTGIAPSKQLHGAVPDNPKGAYPRFMDVLPNRLRGSPLLGKRALRRRRAHDGLVSFTKPLSDDFTLCVKHNAAYTALLQHLLPGHRCVAIIRNPLAILASWNSIDFDLRNGDMTITRQLDRQLAKALSAEGDRLKRQCLIIEWFFSQFDQFLTAKDIIRYESLVTTTNATLQRILPLAPPIQIDLADLNTNRIYNRHLMKRLTSLLLSRPSIIWKYYPPEDIRGLLRQVRP